MFCRALLEILENVIRCVRVGVTCSCCEFIKKKKIEKLDAKGRNVSCMNEMGFVSHLRNGLI